MTNKELIADARRVERRVRSTLDTTVADLVRDLADALEARTGSAAGAAPQEKGDAHTEHVHITECWYQDCLEGDCSHRDELGEPTDMSACPPTPMEVCVACMVDLGLSADPETWEDSPLVRWPCANVEPAVSPRSAWHFGRSFSGTSIEDGCPCMKASCGLVTHAAAETANCPEHSFAAAKTIRQSHSAATCPALVAPVQVDEAKLDEVVQLAVTEWLRLQSAWSAEGKPYPGPMASFIAHAAAEWLRGGGQ